MNFVVTVAPNLQTYEIFIPEWVLSKNNINEFDDYLVKVKRKNKEDALQILSPKTWEKDFVALHPLLLSGFAADFDNDTFDIEIFKNNNEYQLRKNKIFSFEVKTWIKEH